MRVAGWRCEIYFQFMLCLFCFLYSCPNILRLLARWTCGLVACGLFVGGGQYWREIAYFSQTSIKYEPEFQLFLGRYFGQPRHVFYVSILNHAELPIISWGIILFTRDCIRSLISHLFFSLLIEFLVRNAE